MKSKKARARRSAHVRSAGRPLPLNRVIAARLQSELRALSKAASVLGCLIHTSDAPKEDIPIEVDLADAGQVVFEMLHRSIDRLEPENLLNRHGPICSHCNKP